jgi:hypothetical protein
MFRALGALIVVASRVSYLLLRCAPPHAGLPTGFISTSPAGVTASDAAVFGAGAQAAMILLSMARTGAMRLLHTAISIVDFRIAIE